MDVSQKCIDVIKEMEGCRLRAYQDVVGVWTIGFGDTENVYPGLVITQQEAEDRLRNRLNRDFIPGVMKALGGAPVTQSQFDALVSLAYNIGVGGLARSTVIREHVAGNYQAAADAFRMWNKAGGQVLSGLVRRRDAERALYLSEDEPVAVVPEVEKEEEKPEKPKVRRPFKVEQAIRAYNREALRLQKQLQAHGFYEGNLDGDFGPESRTALLAYLKMYHSDDDER